jgi:preprotein translocase subunit YajC
VELLELKKPSMISWNRDTLTILGVIALIGMLVYEIFRRAKKENEELKQNKKAVKKGSKKKH